MQNLYQPETLRSIFRRIENLRPDMQPQWGKMQAAQMLAHCTATLEVATGRTRPPRMFLGRILGSFIKPTFYNDKPLSKNSPTDKSLLIVDERDFELEKKKLITLIQDFSLGGEKGCTTHPHSFYGKFTPAQWSMGTYKHLDHNLTQFGV